MPTFDSSNFAFSEQQQSFDPVVTGHVRHEPASESEKSEENKEVVLSARGICKSYNIGGENHVVLNQINFQVHTGECVFFSGPSGSGKSTLLSILGCLLEQDSGEITIANQRVDNLPIAERTVIRREHIGFVFQRFQLIDALSAEDNVAVPLTLNGESLPDARERAGKLLSRIGLEMHRRQLPRSLSPGQCQRVALARAIIAKPKLVLADEPTAALDGKSGTEVMELLQELISEYDTATLVVTHDPRISKYADRICELENGQFK